MHDFDVLMTFTGANREVKLQVFGGSRTCGSAS